MRETLFIGLLFLVACKSDTDPEWIQFNAEGDSLSVFVGQEAPTGDASCEEGVACTDLHSIVEGLIIGAASVDPISANAGSEHHFVVVVADEWEGLIDRVSVEVDSERGEQSFDLVRDRANLGAWGLTLESEGRPAEQRIDIWTVRLWEDLNENAATGT